MAGMIYQSFILDEKRQIKEDKIKSRKKSIDSKRGEKLINSLKTQYTVFLSNSTYAGVHTGIMVGAELSRAGNIKRDFGGIAQELGLCFRSGAFFTEAI